MERGRFERLLSPLARRALKRDPPPTAGQAAIVFADLIGSTPMAAQLGPERNAELLGHVHRNLFRVAARDGGAVAEVLGDGSLIVFGPGGNLSANCRAALAFAEEVLATPGSVEGIALRYRLTAASGEVRLAELGDMAQARLTVTGDAVNLASRLQSVARDRGYGLVIDGDLWRDAGEPDNVVSAGSVQLPGIASSVAIRTYPAKRATHCHDGRAAQNLR